MKRHTYFIAGLTLIICALMAFPAGAVSLSDRVVQQLKDNGQFDAYVEKLHHQRMNGMNQPMIKESAQSLAASNQAVTHKALVILIDFPDKTWGSGYASADSAQFDSLLFSEGLNPTGSMREFYQANSYGNYTIDGYVTKWYRAAQNHHYYDGVLADGEFYSYDAADLAEEAIHAADDDIMFDDFDNNSDGYIDAVIIIHAGTGYEESGISTEIHSHSNSFSGLGVAVDGVFIRGYTIQPEETYHGKDMNAIGVFCHEWGHVLGLPDLYDVDGSSAGIGNWGLMGSGNYNGSSRLPSHFTAWSKKELGWLTLTNVDANMTGVSIPAVEYNPVAYRLKKDGNSGGLEYWIVENRQQTASDSGLPAGGLIVYHINDGISCLDNWCNSNDWNPRVFVEQADGRYDLQYNNNRGDAGDVFPAGGVYTEFHDRTTPNSKYVDLSSSEVALWNISASDSIMTADFDVNFSRPYLTKHIVVFSDVVGGNGDFNSEAGEMIQVTLRMFNHWADAENVTVTMTTDDTMLTILENTVVFGDLAQGADSTNTQLPFEFEIPIEIESRIDSFFFHVTANGGAYDTNFAAVVIVGKPQIMIVADDDDNLESYADYLIDPFYAKRVPTTIWNTVIAGSPSAADLSEHHVVIWQTGDYRADILSADEITAMKGFLDDGGNLFLNGQGLAKQLSTQDPDFLNNYLHASYVDTSYNLIPVLRPTTGPVSGDLIMMAINTSGSAGNQTVYDHILPVGDGQAEWKVDDYFYPPGQPEDYGAVSYSGDYKIVFFAFGFESIVEGGTPFELRENVFNEIMDFFGKLPTDINDNTGFDNALPSQISLNQNFPNPFNPTTSISYLISYGSGARIDRTRLELFDILGRKVITLIDREEAPGAYKVLWDGRDRDGQKAASGIYFYRLTRGDMKESKKMILLK
ncbi:MAG: M6 family metalloprotease domain-containing protein [FCB group bacterium]|nr:M6 family metalloprotease domain-containing protein [FCB group bacterium]